MAPWGQFFLNSATLALRPVREADLPLNFHPFGTGALWVVVRPRTLDRPWREFSGFDQGDRLVMSPDFVSVIGALLPIAPCGRSSL